MISRKNKLFYLLIPFLILIWSCAKISAPSGGPKDKEPPVVVKSVPENGSRNFRGKKLIITFNEYVVLDKINEKFMVSPPTSKKPTVYLRGKNLNVEFEDNLKDSTTYTFNFQDAIRDLNEGNIIDNFQFVISTGSVIDSLSVTGKVFSALNLNVPENTLVLLYSNLSDSAVKKQLPDYLSRVDQNGSFRINNVREGKYRLYALKDIDNSKNYNVIEEEFAFSDNPVEITPENNYLPVKKDTTLIKPGGAVIIDSSLIDSGNTLILFAAQKKAHYLTSSDRKMPYQLIYTLSLPPDSLKFRFSIPGIGDEAYFMEKSRNNDTIKVWLTDSTLFSMPMITTIVSYPFTDSTGIIVNREDSVRMRYIAPRAPRGKVTRSPFDVKYNISTGSIKPGQQITLTSQTPFKEPDTSRIRLFETIKENKERIAYILIKDTTNVCRYTILAKLTEGGKYLFIADSASLGNIYGETCDSTGIKFSVLESKSFGKMTLNIMNYKGPLIMQLLNNSEKIISEKYLKGGGKVEFPLLEKGTYRVRSVFDLDGDGKWTTGDFTKRRQPEPVSYYFPGEIEIKVDWEVEQDWNLEVKNFKEQKLRDIKKK